MAELVKTKVAIFMAHSVYSSNELVELSRCLFYDDSTINVDFELCYVNWLSLFFYTLGCIVPKG